MAEISLFQSPGPAMCDCALLNDSGEELFGTFKGADFLRHMGDPAWLFYKHVVIVYGCGK